MAISVKLSTLDFLEICLLHSQIRARSWKHYLTLDGESTGSNSSLVVLSESEQGHTDQLLSLRRLLTTPGIARPNEDDTARWFAVTSSLARVNATLTQTLLSLTNDAPPERRPSWLTTQTKRLTCFAYHTEDLSTCDTNCSPCCARSPSNPTWSDRP